MCLIVSAAACSDKWGKPRRTDGVRIHVTFSDEENASRSSYGITEAGGMDNMLILFYTTNGKLAGWIAEPDPESDCFTTGDLITDEEYYIYALAGVPLPEDIEGTFGTMSGAAGFQLAENSITGAPVPYSHVPETTVYIEEGEEYTIELKRVLAKISFMVDCSNLKGSFNIESLNIRQSPRVTHPLAGECRAYGTLDVTDGDCASAYDLDAMNNGGRVTYYLLENLQGEANPGNTDPWHKVPEEMADGKGSLATYVEISGTYRSGGLVIHDLVYRFFLGRDIVSNCDVRRNTVQTVTLSLSDENTILKESWKITRGTIEDGRTFRFEDGLVSVFPYPGRTDTIKIRMNPDGMDYNVSVCDDGDIPFDVIKENGCVIIAAQKFIQDKWTTRIFPVCISTLDGVRRDTLRVYYHSLDGVEVVAPDNLYTDFEGPVHHQDSSSAFMLYNATASNRTADRPRFEVRLNYRGNILSTTRDSTFERGLAVYSSDSATVSASLSETNPTLWSLAAKGIGTARITAGYTMSGVAKSGYKDVHADVLGISLNVDQNINIGKSCNPAVILPDNRGNVFSPVPEMLAFRSSDTDVLTDNGTGRGTGQAVYSVTYCPGNGFGNLTDSKTVTVSESPDSYALCIYPEIQNTIYPGETCRDTAVLIHYVNGIFADRSVVSCRWSISEPAVAAIGAATGSSVTVTGVSGSTRPAILSAYYEDGEGKDWTAEKCIYVTAHSLSVSNYSLVWLANEYGSDCAAAVDVSATPSLSWSISVSGPEKNDFTISPMSGTGAGTLTIFPKFKNNYQNFDKEAKITLSAPGVPNQVIALTQMRDSLLRLTASPDYATLDLNAEAGHPDINVKLYGDWLSGRTGTDVASSTAEWTSSSPSVARHTGNGVITAFGAGTADIIASFRSRKDTIHIKVLDTRPFDTTYIVRITPQSRQTIENGASVSYRATAQMLVDMQPVGNPADVTAQCRWISTEPSAASVVNGVATGHNSGTEQVETLICASYLGYESNYAELAVKGTPEPSHSLTIYTTQSSYRLNQSPFDGEPVTVFYDGAALPQNAGIIWNISNRNVIPAINLMKPSITGPGLCDISATYNGITSNVISYDISSLITSIRLEIKRFVMDKNGMVSEFKDGWISEAFAHVDKTTFNNGESGHWLTIHGGSYSDANATLDIAVYAKYAGESSEHLLGSKTFSFSTMRGDELIFTPSDFYNINICSKYFTFNAIVTVD